MSATKQHGQSPHLSSHYDECPQTLERFKQTVGEGGIRVPLIVSGPGIAAGVKTDAFAYVWDILPPLLAAADAEYPATFGGKEVEQPRGRSMLPALSGEVEIIYSEDETVSGEMAGGKWVRKGSYKAVSVPAPYGVGQWRLFDLAIDPGESIDLGEEKPNQLNEMIAVWETYAEEVGIVPAEL